MEAKSRSLPREVIDRVTNIVRGHPEPPPLPQIKISQESLVGDGAEVLIGREIFISPRFEANISEARP